MTRKVRRTGVNCRAGWSGTVRSELVNVEKAGGE